MKPAKPRKGWAYVHKGRIFHVTLGKKPCWGVGVEVIRVEIRELTNMSKSRRQGLAENHREVKVKP